MIKNVYRCKNINECADPDRLQYLFNTFENEGAMKCLTRHWPKLNHRLYDETLESDLAKAYALGKALTEQKFILLWGIDVGTCKWKSYCNIQAETNSLEYKKKKYGFTDSDFEAFNKSRAVTLENQIKKYGEELGSARFADYCKKQKTLGSSQSYFIEKFGVDAGTERWNKINFMKAHTFDSYMARYEDETIAREKLVKFFEKTSGSYVSKSANSFCESLYNKVKYLDLDCRFYKKDSVEFGIMDTDTKRYYMYDFVIVDIGLIIEYNGDYYHANPSKYKSTDEVRHGMLAADIWANDTEKENAARKRGFKIYTVWESEYKSNQEKILSEIKSYIINHIRI